jgi:hypothetical protein
MIKVIRRYIGCVHAVSIFNPLAMNQNFHSGRVKPLRWSALNNVMFRWAFHPLSIYGIVNEVKKRIYVENIWLCKSVEKSLTCLRDNHMVLQVTINHRSDLPACLHIYQPPNTIWVSLVKVEEWKVMSKFSGWDWDEYLYNLLLLNSSTCPNQAVRNHQSISAMSVMNPGNLRIHK